jgi:hypothetical protein
MGFTVCARHGQAIWHKKGHNRFSKEEGSIPDAVFDEIKVQSLAPNV